MGTKIVHDNVTVYRLKAKQSVIEKSKGAIIAVSISNRHLIKLYDQDGKLYNPGTFIGNKEYEISSRTFWCYEENDKKAIDIFKDYLQSELNKLERKAEECKKLINSIDTSFEIKTIKNEE